jgi:hypothetical protein
LERIPKAYLILSTHLNKVIYSRVVDGCLALDGRVGFR